MRDYTESYVLQPNNLEKAGINGSSFILTFDKPLPENTKRITWDFRNGQDLIVDEVNGNSVKVRLMTNDAQEYLHPKYLHYGVEYFIV